jgi:UDP-glucose:(glucosyl)LPS alpha-1,2-glucosyltransferase
MSYGWEENEVSAASQGGTEITKRALQNSIEVPLLQEFQIIPSRVRNLDVEKIRVYHLHDLAEDPECNKLRDENYRNQFHKFVFSSNWQMQEFATKLGMPMDEKMCVLETPIVPIEPHVKPEGQINLIYFSTPQRGLELLVPVFEELAKVHSNIHLHVHSSFLIYGWKELDEKFEPLYERIRQHPQMTYHGMTTQEELRERLKQCHILAYPNTWKETSCRVLMESMSAGMLCIHPNFGALPDTSGGLTSMYQFLEDPNKHANYFYQYLEHAIGVVQQEDIQKYLRFVKAYADNRFQLNKISAQWTHTLSDMLKHYPTVESRALPARQFVYNTQATR